MVWTLQALPEISDNDFQQWGRLLEERAGIALGEQQRVFLQTQLAMRMREQHFESYADYFDFVQQGLSGLVEWSHLIDRLVVKETRFFRHSPSIQLVAEHLTDSLDNRAEGDHYAVWSLGCASGEEPYSLAMVMQDVYRFASREPLFGITATDISRLALATAREGRYVARKVEWLDEIYRRRYFERLDDGSYRVTPGLRERICFHQGNVLSVDEMPQVAFDVIFCQNLLIYLKKERREQIMNALATRLKPGGLLVIGIGEVVDWTHPHVKRLSKDAVHAYRHL
jgi:type IV pilus assembly protein PilK